MTEASASPSVTHLPKQELAVDGVIPENAPMGISIGLLLAAAGAALIWAVNATVSGVNIHTIGVILLIVGVVGFATSLFFWSSWGGFGVTGTTVARDRVVER